MPNLPPTERTTLNRAAARGDHDRDAIYAILDEGLVAHVGFQCDGWPCVIPLSYGRMGDRLVLHGARNSRLATEVKRRATLCVVVSLLDGLVLARSATHHSVNYRSVVVYGVAEEVVSSKAKEVALRALLEHIVPGRWGEVRPPTDAELDATAVFTMPLDEASAKSRSGPP